MSPAISPPKCAVFAIGKLQERPIITRGMIATNGSNQKGISKGTEILLVLGLNENIANIDTKI